MRSLLRQRVEPELLAAFFVTGGHRASWTLLNLTTLGNADIGVVPAHPLAS